MTAPPALFNNCLKVYQRMYGEAISTPVKSMTDEGVSEHDVLVWTGHTTKLFEDEGLATPQYTFVMQKLIAMGCVIQLQRGGGGGFSKWLLVTEPTRELFDNSLDKPRGRPSKNDIEEQRYRDIIQLLKNLESRISVLEGIVPRG